MSRPSLASELVDKYLSAKSRVVQLGYSSEIAWHDSLARRVQDESDLLRETAWVILCSGFREATVRSVFSYISLCFCDWESASLIVENADLCVPLASKAFGHAGKLNAIVDVARQINAEGITTVYRQVKVDPIGRLSKFPFIGPVTAYHLAKNLGYQFAKDDRHLQRLVHRFGYENAQGLCAELSAATGDSIAVIDTVLWRDSALKARVTKNKKRLREPT